MPCESCSSQFTVFKRKSKCQECKRFFCSNCLSKKNSKVLCSKCMIFLKRPILKSDLNSLKIKDLIFYLQSKHISTTGCVEKEELINLVIASTSQNYQSGNPGSTTTTTSPNADFDYTNSFEQIKQTCQNLFTSFTDKISSDFQKNACFSNAQAPPQQPNRENVTTTQPRSSPDQFFGPPGFSNSQTNTNNCVDHNISSRNVKSNASSETTSPVISSPGDNSSSNFDKNSLSNIPNNDGCECSDDEDDKQTILDNNPGPSGCVANNNVSVKINRSDSQESSSFEELGAVGGGSSENWQFIEKTSSNGVQIASDQYKETPNESNTLLMFQSLLQAPSQTANPDNTKKVMRRRSDSSLIQMKNVVPAPVIEGNEAKKLKVSCKKCGKQKNKIKQEIAKFREQLESSNQSEAEKRAQLHKFLNDLERQSRQSMDITDSEESQPSHQQVNNESGANNNVSTATPTDIEDVFDDINDGIHVYGHNEEQPSNNTVARRFTQLEDISNSNELENLSVKQLKEILMLNRVDFKGCCEKTELQERVKRLWQDHVAAPASDDLSTEELCKICMDKPIQCIFLECGHMATCINCGKVLSECPICRQYVVRVVRFFKS